MESKSKLSKSVLLTSIVVVTCLVIFIPSMPADEVYADIQITVDTAGFVSISGDTNYPDILVENTEDYTSKNQSLWTLNITKDVKFSDFVFSLTLPKQTQINTVSSSAVILIEEEAGHLIVQGCGSNETLSLLVQYQTQKIIEKSRVYGLDTLSIVLILCIILLVIGFLIVLYYVNDKNSSVNLRYDAVSKDTLKGLNQRQQNIVQLLNRSNVALTQTDIQRELGLPKASVSRNIRRLEIKGIIEKEQIGMSNLIRLKKQ